MLDNIYNNNNKEAVNAAIEELSSYKLKTVLTHLNMSTFDYDIRKDVIYVRKDNMLLHDFTDHWFSDGGDFYYLENITERLPELVRESFVEHTLQELKAVKENVSGNMVSFETPLVYKNKATRWTNFVIDTISDDSGRPLYAIGYCKDINKEKKEKQRVRKLAQTDLLTGLRNRANTINRIEVNMNENGEELHFLAVLDLNKFKDANDLFGHSFGDEILKNVADRIQQFDNHDRICGRLGGDEFMIYGRCENEEDAMNMLTELKNLIRHTVSSHDKEFEVNASIGFAIHPLQGVKFDELYNKADIAMYYAKKNKTAGPILYEVSMPPIRR